METVHVRVTKEHIYKGTHCNKYECPVALATIEATGAQRVSCGREKIVIHRGDNHLYADLPRDVGILITLYDRFRQPIQPFEFDLVLHPGLPHPCLKEK